MRLEEVIGANLARLRDSRGMSQAQLGAALSGYLDKPWSRQAVSAAEKGRRAFTAAELLSLALSLRVSLADLLLPLGDGVRDELVLPSGLQVGHNEYARTVTLTADSERGQNLIEAFHREREWVFKLAMVSSTGEDTDSLVDELVDDGRIVTAEQAMALAHTKVAFAERRRVVFGSGMAKEGSE